MIYQVFDPRKEAAEEATTLAAARILAMGVALLSQTAHVHCLDDADDAPRDEDGRPMRELVGQFQCEKAGAGFAWSEPEGRIR